VVSSIGQIIQGNSLVNQVDMSGISQRITQAIRVAANKTGVDFSYLMNKASQESSFDPSAQANSSSATGLFQFTKQTWLQMIKAHGAAYGLSDYANQIQLDSNGKAYVSDPTIKKAILALRNDPQVSAEMAGELDKANMTSLKQSVGGKIGATELYLAHFLGAGGASEFINTLRTTPNATAANILPDAAASNPSVFYNTDGQALSIKQIYQHFAQKFNNAPATTAVASAATTTSPITTSPPITSSAQVYAAATGIYMPSASNQGIKLPASSLYSTMVLAQMNMGDMSSAAALGLANPYAHAHKNANSSQSGLA